MSNFRLMATLTIYLRGSIGAKHLSEGKKFPRKILRHYQRQHNLGVFLFFDTKSCIKLDF